MRAFTFAPWPMAFALALAFGSCGIVHNTRSVLYSDTGSSVAYDDVLFHVLPDWHTGKMGPMDWPQIALRIYALSFTLIVFVVVIQHRLSWILVRRCAFVLGASQLLATICQGSTRMPDPDPVWRVGTFAHYPVLFTVGAAYTTFYRGPWRFTSVMVPVLAACGIALSLACHVQYTVDVLCMIAITTDVFFTLEWAGRSRNAVKRRAWWVQWFEQDLSLIESERLHSSDAPPSDDERPEDLEGPEGEHTDKALPPWCPVELPQPLEKGDPSCAAMSWSVGTPGAPPPTTPVRQRLRYYKTCESRLIDHLHAKLSEDQRQRYPASHAMAVLIFPVVATGMAIVAAALTDVYRPLGRPPMPDVGFRIFDGLRVVVAHDLPDRLCQLAAVSSLLDCLLFQPFPFASLRRAGTVWGLCMFTRFFFVTSTYVADPFPQCSQREHPDSPTCGDCIFSGHTIGFLTAGFCICMFRPSRALHWARGIVTTFCLCLIIATRMHYTRDVVMAVMVFRAYEHMLRATVFTRPDRVMRSRFLLAYELDYYIARGRVLVGYESELPDATAPVTVKKRPPKRVVQSKRHETVRDFAPNSIWQWLHPRRLFRVVRPTHDMPSWFRAVLDAPLTRPRRSGVGSPRRSNTANG